MNKFKRLGFVHLLGFAAFLVPNGWFPGNLDQPGRGGGGGGQRTYWPFFGGVSFQHQQHNHHLDVLQLKKTNIWRLVTSSLYRHAIGRHLKDNRWELEGNRRWSERN